MKTLFKKVVAASAFATLSVGAAHAQPFPNFPQLACMTPLGIFPMNGGIPGGPCGNGMDHGVTVMLPQGPQGGFPGWPGFPGTTGFPGGQGGNPPLGWRGQGAGLLGANREMQLAAECSSAGEPRAVAACIAARLTAEELQKCKNGIGSANGCFGPNNTLRVHLENSVKDLTQGPGESNDITGREGFTCKQLGICF
jgi:hypothetical protein